MSGLATIFDTTVTNVSPGGIKSATYNGYNFWGAGPNGAIMALNTTLRNTSTQTTYPKDTVSNPTLYTLSITDGNGTALSQSNSAYTGANTPTVIFTWNLKDPVTPATPTVFTISVSVSQVGDALLYTVTVLGTSSAYALDYYMVQFGNLVFQSGFVLPPTNPTYPIGLSAGAQVAAFGYTPEVIYLDTTPNTSANPGGVLAVITNGPNQTARRVELLSQSNDSVHYSYLLLIESDGRSFANTLSPQYSNKVAALGSESYTVTLQWAPGGTKAEAIPAVAANIAAFRAAFPSLQNWADSRPVLSIYPSAWGNFPLCVEYAQLFRRNKDGSSTLTFPNGYSLPSPSASNIGDQTLLYEQFRLDLRSYYTSAVAFAIATGCQGICDWCPETADPQAQIGDAFPDPVTGATITAGANSIYVVNDYTPRDEFIGDIGIEAQLTPALAHVSPLSVGGLTIRQECIKIVTDAGIRWGCCVRGQTYAQNAGYHPAHTEPTPPDFNSIYTGGALSPLLQTFVDKIAPAVALGATLIYVDSNTVLVYQLHPSHAEVLHARFPGVLFMIEHSTIAQLRWAKAYEQTNEAQFATPSFARALYPTGGQITYLTDTTTTTANLSTLTAGVAGGDMLMVQGPSGANGGTDVQAKSIIKSVRPFSSAAVSGKWRAPRSPAIAWSNRGAWRTNDAD